MSQIIQILLTILVLILAFPSGYLLAYLCKDELIDGRKWFKLLALISTILVVIFLFFNLTIALTLIFISIVSLISLIKSYNRKFLK
jgi:predicted membrane protein